MPRDQFADNLSTKTKSKLYDKNNKARALTALRSFLGGWNQEHLQWEAMKRTAAEHGINTKLFNRRLGQQFDDLEKVVMVGKLIDEEYGGLTERGEKAIEERAQRVKATIDAYIALCKTHAQKTKRTEEETKVWLWLAGKLNNIKGNITRITGKIKHIGTLG